MRKSNLQTSLGCFLLLAIAMLTGCFGEIGDHYRDIADYNAVKSRFPQSSVQHFPDSAPEDAKMYGYFVPMQGGDGLQLSVTYGPADFAALLTDAEAQGYDSAIGIDLDDPETLLRGKSSPRISLGVGEPETPKPSDRIFTIQDGPAIDCGMIFRTDQQTVVYWVYRDE